MSERYARLFSLPDNLYAKDSPVLIAAGALLKDRQEGKVLAQLKLQNISGREIKAATVRIEPLDTTGKPLGDAVSYQYLDLKVKRDTFFGQKVPVMLPDDATREFHVSVSEVVFTDNSIWQGSVERWETLPKQKILEFAFSEAELVKEYRIRYGADCKYLYREDKDLWRCACGALNRKCETNCHSCGKEAAILCALDVQALEKSKEKRLTEEAQKRREEEEARRARAEEERRLEEQKKKRNRKIGMIAAAVIVVAAAGRMIYWNQQRNAAYQKAQEMFAGGDYDGAETLFLELGNYKDSAEQAKEACYEKAIRTKETGDFASAIAQFEALGGYRDSADQILQIESEQARVEMEQELTAHAEYVAWNLKEWMEESFLSANEELQYLSAEFDDWESNVSLDQLADYSETLRNDLALLENYMSCCGEYEEFFRTNQLEGIEKGDTLISDFYAIDGQVYWHMKIRGNALPYPAHDAFSNAHTEDMLVNDDMTVAYRYSGYGIKVELTPEDITITLTGEYDIHGGDSEERSGEDSPEENSEDSSREPVMLLRYKKL